MTEEQKIKFYELLGERIKLARKKAGMKQEAFAACIGLSRVSIVNIERGRQHPQIHLLLDIASTLKIEVRELIPEVIPSDTNNLELDEIINGKLKELKSLKQVKVDKKTEDLIKGFVKEFIFTKPKS